MAFKIKISKPNFNVLAETNPKNLIFDSDLNHLKNKIASSFTTTLASGGSFTQTVAHGLGAVRPLAMAFFRDTAGSDWFISFNENFPGGGGELRKSTSIQCELYTDTTNVYIKVTNNSGVSKTVEVQYEIFYENA